MINERAKAILYFCFKKTKMDKWFKKDEKFDNELKELFMNCLLYTSPSPRDIPLSRMPSSA